MPKDLNTLRLGTLEKAYKILDIYNTRAESLSFSEIVERSGLEKGSVQRLLHTLEYLGLLTRHQRYKRYTLSTRFLSYAVSFLQSDSIIIQAAKYIEPIAEKSSESIGITLLDGIHTFGVSRVPNIVSRDYALLPTRSYAVNTAGGRAIMSRMPEEAVKAILARSPYQKLTRHTLTNPEEIWARILEARNAGFAYQSGEYQIGELAISAPILGEMNMPVGAVTITIDSANYTTEQAIDAFAGMIMSAANNMSNQGLPFARARVLEEED